MENKTGNLLRIIIAGFMDALDGRIARLSGTESNFGREYDSLADLLTFGAAPALLTHLWGLHEFGRIGWLVPLFYLVCAATRLARFNVQSQVVDSRYFTGLPAPAAAGFIASILFVAPSQDLKPWLNAVVLTLLIVVGILMVSTIRYVSFKRIDLRKRRSYRTVLPLAVIILLAVYHPPAFFLTSGIIYTLSGPTGWLVGRVRQKNSEKRAERPTENTAE